MEKRWGIASFVALALLGCLAETRVEAQSQTVKQSQSSSGSYPSWNPSAYLPPPTNQQTPSKPKKPPQIWYPPSAPTDPQTPNYPPSNQNPQTNNPQSNPQNQQGAYMSHDAYASPQKPKPPPPSRPQTPVTPPPPKPQRPQISIPPPPPSKPKRPQTYIPPPPPNKPPTSKKTPQTPQAASDQSYQRPQVNQQRPEAPAVVKHPNSENCMVDLSVRVPCGASNINPAECDAINCCHDGIHCYFGKAVTVQCTKDGHFIIVVAKDATLPNIDITSISLLGGGPSCTAVASNSAFAIYYFPVTSCGTTVVEESGVICYENMMVSTFEVNTGARGAITRDSHYKLMFQCRYIGYSVEAVVVEVLSLDAAPPPVAAIGPLNVHLRLGNGQCHTKGCDEASVAYTSYYMDYDYPVSKVLRDMVYVEVHLQDRTDPRLVLTLDRCWVTTSPNPHSMPQWDILVNGCPNWHDRYRTVLIPTTPDVDFVGHYRRFSFQMFTFVESVSMDLTKQHLFLHCSTSVCYQPPGGTCEPMCSRTSKTKRDTSTLEQPVITRKPVASSRLVIMNQPAEKE